MTTEFLWLTPSVVGDEEGTVVLDEGLLQLVLGVLVDELLVVCDLCPSKLAQLSPFLCQVHQIAKTQKEERRTYDRLCNGLSDGVDLRGVTTASDAYADVDVSEALGADYKEGFVDLGRKLAVVCEDDES